MERGPVEYDPDFRENSRSPRQGCDRHAGAQRNQHMPLREVSLQDKYTLQEGRVYLTGTQALVRLPIMQQERDKAAGHDTACYISGYRGSPLGGFDQQLWAAK